MYMESLGIYDDNHVAMANQTPAVLKSRPHVPQDQQSPKVRIPFDAVQLALRYAARFVAARIQFDGIHHETESLFGSAAVRSGGGRYEEHADLVAQEKIILRPRLAVALKAVPFGSIVRVRYLGPGKGSREREL